MSVSRSVSSASFFLPLQIADFGSARHQTGTATAWNPGTLLWASPEVLKERKRSLLSDVWSVGCTAVELFSERDPYYHLHENDDRKRDEIIQKIKNRELVRRRYRAGDRQRR